MKILKEDKYTILLEKNLNEIYLKNLFKKFSIKFILYLLCIYLYVIKKQQLQLS